MPGYRDKINIKKGEFTIRGKGQKPRLVFLSNRAKIALANYLNQRQDDYDPVFIRHDQVIKPKEKQELLIKHFGIRFDGKMYKRIQDKLISM